MSTVLRSEKYHKEMNELLKSPHIYEMVSDLLRMGKTYQEIKTEQNFKVLNNRYKILSGKDALRLGSVKEAILEVFPK